MNSGLNVRNIDGAIWKVTLTFGKRNYHSSASEEFSIHYVNLLSESLQKAVLFDVFSDVVLDCRLLAQAYIRLRSVRSITRVVYNWKP